jgi:hypothetical protein
MPLFKASNGGFGDGVETRGFYLNQVLDQDELQCYSAKGAPRNLSERHAQVRHDVVSDLAKQLRRGIAAMVWEV